jgi:hypothetical protein
MKGFLHHVFSIRDAAEHPIGNGQQQVPMLIKGSQLSRVIV